MGKTQVSNGALQLKVSSAFAVGIATLSHGYVSLDIVLSRMIIALVIVP